MGTSSGCAQDETGAALWVIGGDHGDPVRLEISSDSHDKLEEAAQMAKEPCPIRCFQHAQQQHKAASAIASHGPGVHGMCMCHFFYGLAECLSNGFFSLLSASRGVCSM
jgi:hypothetical protein